MARLNQSFGITIIQLNANRYQSKVLYPSIFRDLDFKSIDKLYKMNKEFERFIEQKEKLMTTNEKYAPALKKSSNNFVIIILLTIQK